MTETKYTPGRIAWRELVTRDTARAKSFYGDLFGWKFEEVTMPGGHAPYGMIKVGDKSVGGMMSMPAGMSAPPHWMSYVSCTDVDAAAKTVAANGGRVLYGPEDIPGVGRFATLMDPDGASFTAFKSSQGDMPPAMPKLGEFCWETIVTKDEKKAIDFYGKVFGWKTRTGPGGAGSVFTVDGTNEGSVVDIQKADGTPPCWITYVVVEKLETARDRATKLGAQIPMPLIEVPNTGRIAMMIDPEGAALGLFQPQM